MPTPSGQVRTPSVADPRALSLLAAPDSARVLIFDWDGTLADSAAVNFAGLEHALASQGVSITQMWHAQHAGLSIEDLLATLSAFVGRALDIENAVAARDRFVLSHLDRITPNPIVLAVAERTAGRLPMAIATGNHRRLVQPALDALGIAPLFDAVITRDDVEAGKPAPDLFLLAASVLQVAPAWAHVYEDTPEGLSAAAAAGMTSTDVRPALALARSLATVGSTTHRRAVGSRRPGARDSRTN